MRRSLREMTITADIFAAYLKCPTKCFLQAHGETGSENEYANWVRTESEAYRAEGLRRLAARIPAGDRVTGVGAAENLKTVKWQVAVDLTARVGDLESRIHAVERIPPEGRGRVNQFIPVRFVFTNKLGKDDKLLVAYDALVLSEMVSRTISLAKIVHGDDHATLKVKTASLRSRVGKFTEKIAALISADNAPDLALNRHCGECEFQTRCRQKAVEKDDLSLLAGMAEKERKKLHGKGIFTVTQLSYTFRPRRRPKRLRDKREKYHHSLKALAIREKKIYIVGTPELKIEGTPVYFDVEGLSDRDYYYLIGMRIGDGVAAVQHSLWASKCEDEKQMWYDFLAILDGVEHPVLIHYGRYETQFLKAMAARYNDPVRHSPAAEAVAHPVNLLSHVYGRVYFPTCSNGLKAVARHLGFEWSTQAAGGLAAVVWRERWRLRGNSADRESLIRYNADDCEALGVVTRKVHELAQAHSGTATSSDGVVDTTLFKRENLYGFKRNMFCFPELDVINKAAYWDYQRERIYVRTVPRLRRTSQKRIAMHRSLPVNKTVLCSAPQSCPRCGATKFYGHGKGTKTVYDLRFSAGGVRRWVTRYHFHRYKCEACHFTFLPPNRPWTRSRYGPGILAYAIYHSIGMRMSLEGVYESLNRLFGLDLAPGTINELKAKAARAYQDTYERLTAKIVSGSLIHADETKVSVKGVDGFVWVFASMEEVIYVYAETREGDTLERLPKGFTGVLVSDFYAGYDSIQCVQQKCLIHLMRDLNDAVLKHPYDEELKGVVRVFASLVQPMVETVDRYGLKRHFMKKHLRAVNRFYRELSKGDFRTEAAVKFKDRFERNRNKLFTFLSHDGVPWNNNNAEHAIKAFAMLRNVIGGVTSERGLRDYLVLLSICQTCKYRGLDFLDFLRSGEKNIEAFALSRRRGRRASPAGAPLSR